MAYRKILPTLPTMKWFKRIAIALVVLIVLIIVGGYFWLRSSKPVYQGEVSLQGMQAPAEIFYDETGIPHVYSQSRADLYRAFGYVHAQDRLFQMELMRRIGSGRLAEIIGQPVVKVDKVFRTLQLPQYAQQSAALLRRDTTAAVYQDIMAYLDGVNQFMMNGPTPPEFSILSIPKNPFTLEDMYAITGAMSFSFSQAQKTDPVVNMIAAKYGVQHLRDLALWHDSTETFIPHFDARKDSSATQAEAIAAMAAAMSAVEDLLPVAPLEGSNSWVVSGSKTKSGQVMFCNDTHIGYNIPQTWYEAHLHCPEFEIYGHFLAGLPFPLVGRNEAMSWGLTMLLNDDMDFYQEKFADATHTVLGDTLMPVQLIDEVIKVKGEEDTVVHVRRTVHGPIVSDAFDGIGKDIAMKWTYTAKENRTVQALYGMCHAPSMEAFETALADIHAPGLNITYGDRAGNIAWWACAHLVKRPPAVNSWMVLNGASGEDEWQGYYDFKENPRSINPTWGYVYSANDWPDKVAGEWYPGYYKPQYRADRIRKLLDRATALDTASMKAVMNDHINETDSIELHLFGRILAGTSGEALQTFEQYKSLFFWNGGYTPESNSAVLFNRLLYNMLEGACKDELGDLPFRLLMGTHQVQRAQFHLLTVENSPWWDDVNTPQKESRTEVVSEAFLRTVRALEDELGKNPKLWMWKDVCTLELKHPLGEVALFRPIFNRGPYPVYGGNETILQSGFKMDSTGVFKVFFGSQMRMIVDFGDAREAISITPCGQSGHVMSEHYSDQALRYVHMGYRKQWMKEEHVRKFPVLRIRPQ